MARGTLRAATNAYRGVAGATRQAPVHVTLPSGEVASVPVYTAVDVVADPELGQRLLADGLNAVRLPDGTSLPIATPVVYHDPSNALMVLVLAETDRHRELAERARLLAEMAADPATAVPAYARDFGVVFGGRGLRAFLEAQAEKAVAAARAAEAEREVERERIAGERRRAEVAAQAAELEAIRADLERRRAELERAEAALASARAEHDRRAIEAPTGPFDLAADVEAELPTGNQTVIEAAAPDTIPPPFAELPAGSDPVETHTADERAPAEPTEPGVFAEEQGVRIALRAPAALARGPLDVRLQLHRTPHYPVVTITIGTPAALRGGGPQRATAMIDIAQDGERRALAMLTRRFQLTVDLLDGGGRRGRRVLLTAPLEANAAYIARAAQDHLRSLTAEGGAPSMARARQLLADPDHDLLGLAHAEASEFRDDKLGQLATANQVRRALAIARRFSKPPREDYLVTIRGYPLARFHERRRQVLARAVEWGLWMGPDLAAAAVSEGLARSRKDLVAKLEAGFDALLADAVANDLDADAAEDNRNALAEEARALGVGVRAVASSDAAVASGTIPGAVTPRARTVEDLVRLLDDREQRLGVALELCERGDPRAIRPVMQAVRRMGRAEAVRVLGASVKFGEAAAPALTAGLASSKAFLRHGCALALGMLRTEAGTEAVIDLLLTEPTEIWRELARTVGQIGPPALMPLAARMGRLGAGASDADRERVAWAMAHIGVRGGRAAVETLSGGASVVAPVARQALDLMAPAARDDLRNTAGREVTVNRAFSRKFFEALGQGGLGELEAFDASSPMEMLDEADLLDVDGDQEGDEAELDESDLIES